jgi:hypothetical protein
MNPLRKINERHWRAKIRREIGEAWVKAENDKVAIGMAEAADIAYYGPEEEKESGDTFPIPSWTWRKSKNENPLGLFN